MKERELLGHRLAHQRLLAEAADTPEQLVAWMGAIQAQNAAMAKWALGSRVHKGMLATVNQALDEGTLIRTHLLRPTWHLIRAEDLLWMTRLTAPQIRQALKSRDKELGITAPQYLKAEKIIHKALENKEALARSTVLEQLKAHKIRVDDNRGAHFLLHAELEALICSGPQAGGQPTYALVEKRLGRQKEAAEKLAANLSREEALARLAGLYFQSRGPATLKDFEWWSGLRSSDARKGLEAIATTLHTVILAGQSYFSPVSLPATGKKIVPARCHLLAAFDEYMISYKDRSAAIEQPHHAKAFSKNGIFWPVVLLDGKAAGIWSAKPRAKGLSVQVQSFEALSEAHRQRIGRQARSYGQFMELPVQELSFGVL